VQWAELLHHEGFPLTLLSNMPLELSRHVTKSFPSLSIFEHLIYSCDYRSIKPELALYRNCLELLKVDPQDILYLDDRAENVEAATRLGINSVLFDTVEKTASRVESQFDIPVPSYW
jgi:putative hydrolase of the HAD superfamily